MIKRRSPQIHIQRSHEGLLHKDLGVEPGEPIPEKKLQSGLNSSNPAVKRRAVFAQNAKSFNHS